MQTEILFKESSGNFDQPDSTISKISATRWEDTDQIFIRYQRLATAANLKNVGPGTNHGNGHLRLLIPERAVSEYNEDLFFLWNLQPVYS